MKLTRIVCAATMLAGAAWAQDGAGDSVATLTALAQRAEAVWLGVARDLDARLARMRLCDARVASSIQEVQRASEARSAALARYLEAAIAEAADQTEAARTILDTEAEALAAASAESEDVAQELAGVESQLFNLSVSLRDQPALSSAFQQLQRIRSMIKQRADRAGEESASGTELVTIVDDLVSVLARREEALRQQAAASETERVRWNNYYTARLARAESECRLTGGRP
jgi:hypothetical protein